MLAKIIGLYASHSTALEILCATIWCHVDITATVLSYLEKRCSKLQNEKCGKITILLMQSTFMDHCLLLTNGACKTTAPTKNVRMLQCEEASTYTGKKLQHLFYFRRYDEMSRGTRS